MHVLSGHDKRKDRQGLHLVTRRNWSDTMNRKYRQRGYQDGDRADDSSRPSAPQRHATDQGRTDSSQGHAARDRSRRQGSVALSRLRSRDLRLRHDQCVERLPALQRGAALLPNVRAVRLVGPLAVPGRDHRGRCRQEQGQPVCGVRAPLGARLDRPSQREPRTRARRGDPRSQFERPVQALSGGRRSAPR